MIAEAAAQAPRPGAVVLSVGSGGLMCGVLQGMHAVGWHDVPLVAAETVGADSLHAAVRRAVAREHRLIVEPACGAAVAVALRRAEPVLKTARDVLVILCGGACATYEDLASFARAEALPG